MNTYFFSDNPHTITDTIIYHITKFPQINLVVLFKLYWKKLPNGFRRYFLQSDPFPGNTHVALHKTFSIKTGSAHLTSKIGNLLLKFIQFWVFYLNCWKRYYFWPFFYLYLVWIFSAFCRWWFFIVLLCSSNQLSKGRTGDCQFRHRPINSATLPNQVAKQNR